MTRLLSLVVLVSGALAVSTGCHCLSQLCCEGPGLFGCGNPCACDGPIAGGDCGCADCGCTDCGGTACDAGECGCGAAGCDSGCADPCGGDCEGAAPCFPLLHHLLQSLHMGCHGYGCGEAYWNGYYNDPPDACEPCDGCGNWVGSTGPCRAPYRSGPVLAQGAPMADDSPIFEAASEPVLTPTPTRMARRPGHRGQQR